MNRNGPLSTSTARDDVRPLVEAVHRLDREFRGSVHPSLIRTVVRHSRDELDCPSAEALPELVERLARQRLLEHVGVG
jgi:hypothetical protein